MQFHLVLWWLLSVFTLATAARVLKPSQDLWYEPPANLSDAKLGDVLKIRAVPHKLRLVYFSINVAGAWQVMVRSQTKEGEPVSVVNTVIAPHHARPDRVLFFQMAQDTSDPDCAPLYLVLSGALMLTIYNQLEMATLQLALDRGWYVVLPDYETIHGWWPGGKQTGYAVLDSVRGVVKHTEATTQISPKAKVSMWGYLGGSIPTKWALALIPRYAPDLRRTIVGAAVGGVVSNLGLTARHNEGTLYAGLVALAVGGLAKQYPEFDALLRDQLSDAHYAEINFTQTKCMVPAVIKFRHKRFFTGDKPYARDGITVLDFPLVQKIFKEHTMADDPHTPYPHIPMLLYHAKNDEIINYHDSEVMFHSWCKKGIKSLEFVTDTTLRHVNGIITGGPMVVQWLEQRMDGVKPTRGCDAREITSFLHETNVTRWLLAKDFVSSIWGRPVGPNPNAPTKLESLLLPQQQQKQQKLLQLTSWWTGLAEATGAPSWWNVRRWWQLTAK